MIVEPRYIVSYLITFLGALAVRYVFGFEVSVLLLGAVLIQLAYEILSALKRAEASRLEEKARREAEAAKDKIEADEEEEEEE